MSYGGSNDLRTPIGVLLVRVWTEGPPTAPELRARFLSSLDIVGRSPFLTEAPPEYADGVQAIEDATRRWVAAYDEVARLNALGAL